MAPAVEHQSNALLLFGHLTTLAPPMPSDRLHLLSKSTFMRGQQCLKQLSLYTHRRELMPPVTEAQQAVFDAGNRVGRLAQDLFPGGVDLRPDSARDFRESLQRTAAAVAEETPILYEAAFLHEGVLAAVDILRRQENGWQIIEVKSTGRVKPQHIEDAALQYHVLTACGLSITDVSILHLNTSYERQGRLDLTALFTETSIFDGVLALAAGMPDRIADCKQVVLVPDEPAIPTGRHCTVPYECPFMAHCWQGEPTPTRGPKRVDTEALRRFLADLRYPLHYMDFETVSSPVPLFDGTRPYNPIPFQFSVHRQEVPGGPISQQAFLARGDGDPRPDFIKALLRSIGPEGDILAYNLPFEACRLKELAAYAPQYRTPLNALLARCKDLIVPFRSGWYYVPEMGTSNSIKSVLPALVPDLGYADLAIPNGEVASRHFLDLLEGRFVGDVQKLRKDLLEYCALDTLAMVRILAVLGSESAT